MTDLERARDYDADRLWASVVKETGIWLAPYSDQVADFGRLLIPKMREALAAARREGAAEMRERAARLHEDIDPACDHERQHGTPGAGAMGAVIRYRDAIRALKDKSHD